MVYPTLLAAIADVAHPSWRASSVGVHRLWRDLGYAIGALIAGITADALDLEAAIWLIAAVTFASGLVVAIRMRETLRRAAPAEAALGGRGRDGVHARWWPFGTRGAAFARAWPRRGVVAPWGNSCVAGTIDADRHAMKFLFILNAAPYGSEHTYNGLRLAGSLSKREGVELRVFLIGDAVSGAHRGQKVPSGYYNVATMLGALTHRACAIGVCGSCIDARGITDAELVEGAHRSSMEELTTWTLEADKVITF